MIYEIISSKSSDDGDVINGEHVKKNLETLFEDKI